MSKYVFFDIDGTLWDENMVVPESTKVAIRQMRENGHKAFICTGRSMGNVNDPQFEEIGFDGIVAACGTHIEMDGTIIFEEIMSPKTVKDIFDASRNYHMPIIYEGPKYLWLDRNGFEGDAYINYIVERLTEIAIYLDETHLEDIHANKFSALVNENTDFDSIKVALKDSFDILDHGGGIVEAVPVGHSKATGIEWLCNHLNIPIEDTFALGDSVNDLEMLGFVGHSIAMGNASDVAKEVAEYVTTHIHEDGIKNALEHYGLI